MLTLNQKLPGQQPKYKISRPHRPYRPGKIPSWVDEKGENSDESDTKDEEIDQITEKSDEEKYETEKIESKNERKVFEPKIISETPIKIDIKQLKAPKIKDLSITENNERRERLKNRLLKNQKIKSEIEIEKNNSETSSSDFESEFESDSDSETLQNTQNNFITAMGRRFAETKPKFVSKKEREARQFTKNTEDETYFSIQTENESDRAKRLDERRKESVQIVINTVRAEERAQKEAKKDLQEKMPDDNDDIDEEVEFEKWKLRELKRMKRDADERTKFEEEQLLIEKRRQMTEEEREIDNMKHCQERYAKEKGQMRFLQKYYHKGAFYQDNDLISKDIMKRDFLQPVGDDKYTDRTLLPDVLQVKNFGLASRTKYTHLVDQDTTLGTRKLLKPYTDANGEVIQPHDRDFANLPLVHDKENPVNPWNDDNSSNSRNFKRLGGFSGFERPSRRKKR